MARSEIRNNMVKGGGGGKQEECSEIKNIEEKSREELK